MAKPRVVKLASPGQATLIYMSEEKADEYEKLLLNYDAGKAAAKDSGSALEHTAVGMFLDPADNQYKIVEIQYSPLTREAKFGTIEPAATLKNRATDKFKLRLMRLKLV